MTTEEKRNCLLRQMSVIPFDIASVVCCLDALDSINQEIKSPNGIETTLFQVALESNNYAAVKFLLEHGADPNHIIGEGSLADAPLWDLQYPPDNPKDTKKRLDIAKLCFEYGADPCLEYDGETLYDYVIYKVFNEIGDPDWDYTVSFFIILLAYGGTSKNYRVPEFTESIDKNRIDEYSLKFFLCEDGYHIEGYLQNPDGSEIGQI